MLCFVLWILDASLYVTYMVVWIFFPCFIFKYRFKWPFLTHSDHALCSRTTHRHHVQDQTLRRCFYEHLLILWMSLLCFFDVFSHVSRHLEGPLDPLRFSFTPNTTLVTLQPCIYLSNRSGRSYSKNLSLLNI